MMMCSRCWGGWFVVFVIGVIMLFVVELIGIVVWIVG